MVGLYAMAIGYACACRTLMELVNLKLANQYFC